MEMLDCVKLTDELVRMYSLRTGMSFGVELEREISLLRNHSILGVKKLNLKLYKKLYSKFFLELLENLFGRSLISVSSDKVRKNIFEYEAFMREIFAVNASYSFEKAYLSEYIYGGFDREDIKNISERLCMIYNSSRLAYAKLKNENIHNLTGYAISLMNGKADTAKLMEVYGAIDYKRRKSGVFRNCFSKKGIQEFHVTRRISSYINRTEKHNPRYERAGMSPFGVAEREFRNNHLSEEGMQLCEAVSLLVELSDNYKAFGSDPVYKVDGYTCYELITENYNEMKNDVHKHSNIAIQNM